MKHWQVVEVNKTKEGKVISIRAINPEYRDMDVSFKWDGCINLYKYFNGYTVDDEYSEEVKDNIDYIHICDINDMIEQLQEIKKIAEKMFDENDYERYWE